MRVGAEVIGKGQKGTFWGNDSVPNPLRSLGYTHLFIYLKNASNTPLRVCAFHSM